MMSLWSQKKSCKICGDLWLILTTNCTNYTNIFSMLNLLNFVGEVPCPHPQNSNF